MCCNPPLKFDYILSDKQKRSPSFVQGRTNTHALHPLTKGRRATFSLSWYHLHALMPRDTSLVKYKHTPVRLRGHPAEVYSRIKRFLLATPGFFSQRTDVWAFHQPPIL